MNKTKIAAGVVALLVAGAGGHLFISSTAMKAGRQAMQAIEKSLPAGSTFSHGTIGANGYSRNGGVRNVFYDSPTLSVTVGAVRVRDFAREGETIAAAVIGFEDVVINFKDKGVRYNIKRGHANGSNLIEVIRAARKASPEELARMLKAKDFFIAEVATAGNGSKVTLGDLRGTDMDAGTIARLQMKQLAADGKSIAACAGDTVPATRVAAVAASLIAPGQEAAAVDAVSGFCK